MTLTGHEARADRHHAHVSAAVACDQPKQGTTGPVISPMPRASQSPSPLTGDESTTVTGLRLLTDVGLVDVVSAALQSVSANSWLLSA